MFKKDIIQMSDSIIWSEIQKYYQELGPLAWQKDIVPYQITSNKIIAHLYATLINAAILDLYKTYSRGCHEDGYISHEYIGKPDDIKYEHIIQENIVKEVINQEVINNEPIYILELGAGHGKFSFYLCKLLESFNLFNKFNIIYIASDISLKNIEHWKHHPQLEKYIKNKQLDFACFDASKDQQIHLMNNNIIIKEGLLQNNLIVIANYIFDTLAQDAFKINDHKLFASSLNLNYKNKFCLEKIKYTYSHKLINAENYYENPIFNQILLSYQKDLKDGTFLFPIGALQSINNITKFSRKSTIFLAADKGNADLNDFKTEEEPSMAVHGSISFMLNFDAISRFLKLTQGYSIINPNSYTDLKIAYFINTNNSSNYNFENSLLAFVAKRVLYDINPLNLINLCYDNEHVNSLSNLKQVLSILAISKWDPDLFYYLSEQLLEFISAGLKNSDLNIEQEHDLEQGLSLVSEYYFKLSKEQDIPFIIGNIYYTLEKFDKAINYFNLSKLDFNPTVEVWYNLSLCYYAKQNMQLARQFALQALEIDSKYQAAKELLNNIR